MTKNIWKGKTRYRHNGVKTKTKSCETLDETQNCNDFVEGNYICKDRSWRNQFTNAKCVNPSRYGCFAVSDEYICKDEEDHADEKVRKSYAVNAIFFAFSPV